jgi:FAD-linked oxidoreductase
MTIDRRKLMGTAAAAGIAASLPVSLDPLSAAKLNGGGVRSASAHAAEAGEASGARKIPWTNWSGSQTCEPETRVAPRDEEELREIVAAAKGPVRPVGAGHSFTELVPTEDTILSLARLSGVAEHESKALQTRIGAGTRLGAIGRPMAAMGQGLYNMPDIDQQSLAGAIATGTHGTGAELSALHHYITEMRLVTASGDVMELSREKNGELFDAARVNLGALGVVSELTLRNLPTYNLEKTTWTEPFDDVLDRIEELGQEFRNFEFYYIPFSDMCICIGHNITDKAMVPRGPNEDNEGAMTLKTVRDYLGWWPWARKKITRSVLEDVEMEYAVDEWWKVYPSERTVRFNEMEFHVPREEGPKVIREIKEKMEGDNISVFFPFEFRFIDEDDAWLSPFYKRKSCSIAIHRYFKEDRTEMFEAMEPIYRAHDGRAHWGKHNSLTAEDCAALYPKWSDFLEVRAMLDPEGKFLNSYLKGLMS